MGPGLLALALLAAPPPQSPDTSTFSSPAAQALIARAVSRHQAEDRSVTDYRARLRYRLSVALGRRRWANAPPFAAEEQEARVAWALPNDLRVDIVGQRARAREAGAQFFSAFDSPWFVPRGLSDSVRVFGTDFPERAALHPLARDGPDWYRYVLGDTVTLATPEGRRIRLARVDVTPKRAGPALIAGQLWLDLADAEVVRLAFRYVGTDLWQTPEGATRKDSSSARRTNRLVNRILSIDADLEYALQEGRHWMPYRQVLSGRIQIPIVSDVYLPFEAVTTFSDYEINTGRPIAFRLPRPEPAGRRTGAALRAYRDSMQAERRGRARVDSTRAREIAGLLPGGGRWEIRRAPRDSLVRYADWGDSLRLRVTEADEQRLRQTQRELADLVEGLDPAITGASRTGFSYERMADAFRFNRVEGTSVGLGYRLDVRALRYASLFATARFGWSDRRLMARVALVRDAPAGKLTAAVYRDLGEGDPFSRGLSAANAVRALVSTRDEADYYLATGGSLQLETALRRGVDITLSGRVEREGTVRTAARAWLNDWFGGDGVMAINPPIVDGTYGGLLVRLDGFAGRSRWQLAADGLARFGGGVQGARLHGSWRQPIGARTGAALRFKGGLATRPVPEQMAWRVGGQGTVRGFDYGRQRGDAFWAVQGDWILSRNRLRPVVFVDAGQAAGIDALGTSPALVGGGVGVSALNGLLRLDLSHPITPRPAGSGFRLDLSFGTPR